VVGDSGFPDRLECRPAQLDDGGVIGNLLAERHAVAAEVVEHRPLLVQQPEVVARQRDARREPAGKPPQVFARLDGRPGPVPFEPDVITHRFRHDAGSADAHAVCGDAPHEVQPFPSLGVLGGVVTAAGRQEPLKALLLVLGGVGVAHFQVRG
jgi:hypothetical protein